MTTTTPSDPVFVFGALRSGTTVFHLMLDAHPRIANPGEVDFLFDHLQRDATRQDGWRYDVAALREDRIFRNHDIDLPDGLDGLALLAHMIACLRPDASGALTLNVHRNADRIAQALPKARIIHLVRDPRDVARSSIGMGWAGTSYYGVAHWVRTEEGWDRAGIPPDRVLTVKFETLIAEVEAELSRICSFLGVPFDPAMLDYHHGSNFGPPDPAITFAWKRKASAREIALIEGRAGALMVARGYDPSGPPHLPGRLERLVLALENRWRRWHFNIRRYGLPLFAGEHLTRLMGLKPLHRRLWARQEEIRARYRQ
jgi:hypothetical protein